MNCETTLEMEIALSHFFGARINIIVPNFVRSKGVDDMKKLFLKKKI